jgi:iron complex transport system substrate-binding protein
MANKIVLFASGLLVFVASFSLREHFCLGPKGDSSIFVDSRIVAVPEQGNYRRIVSMAPSITETIYALGLNDRLVGVTRFCKYPPDAQRLPKVGGFFDPNFEAIVALRPDLVILLVEHEQSLPGFQKLGMKTQVVCHKYIEGTIDSLRSIARLCGVASRGDKLADDIELRLDRIHKKTALASRPRVMISVDRIQGSGRLVDVYIAGADGFFDKMIELAGGENAYRQTVARFPVVSTEGIMKINPDVIIDLVSGVDQTGNGDHAKSDIDAALNGETNPRRIRRGLKDDARGLKDEGMGDWQGLTNVEAVKEHQVYAINRDYATVPGPRFILFVEDLARLLHPEIDWNGP